MLIQNSNNQGFTLLEVLLAAVIFVISVAGIFSTMTAMRRPVVNKESTLSSTVFGNQVLEALRTQVDASTYYTPCASVDGSGNFQCFDLTIGTHHVPHGNLPAGLTWPATLAAQNTACDVPNGCLVYKVLCADGSTNQCDSSHNPDMARRVDLNINMPSAS